MKKIAEKKEKAPPEKFFQRAILLYFSFHKINFRDEDGYALAPNWDNEKRGMEMKGLKLLLTTLREIAEGKGIEWTEERMISDFNNFLERAYNNTLVRKNFLCCMMNRFKLDILSTPHNPNLSKQVREIWYAKFPNYTRDEERDKTASEIIIGFLKQQFLQKNIEFNPKAVIQTVDLIFRHVQADEFWSKKTMRSVANNLQEFISKIKENKKNGTATEIRGNDYSRGFETRDSSPDNKKDFGNL